ncbi:MAG: pyridoxal kinase PdxY [Treponema sp.]|nr:pyridoxal kinase PdxY [Treponema sp.]
MAVLSVQSHVVYGYAGNTAAVFPLQRMGSEVWAINTVEFSNHTGYGAWRGKILETDLIYDLIEGLEERGALGKCEAVLSGYLGDAASGKAVADAVKKVRSANTGALYCCDPVMGDTGRGFYVKSGIPEMFINELVPLADIVCPNQFELEALTGVTIDSMENAKKAVNILHEKGPSIVLVTSFEEKDGEIGMLASDQKNLYKITTPKLPLENSIAGTGDMTTAVFLSHYLSKKNLIKTLELCAGSVYSILEESYRSSKPKTGALLELMIIETQEQLISPKHSFKAEKVTL